MFEGLRDKAGHLDDAIWHLGELLLKEHDLGEPQCVAQTLPDTAPVLGRICCDAADAKLNPQSILLQGSQDGSGGRDEREFRCVHGEIEL